MESAQRVIRFASGNAIATSEVIDMEAYALAKVCWLERTSFGCVQIHHRRGGPCRCGRLQRQSSQGSRGIPAALSTTEPCRQAWRIKVVGSAKRG